MMFGNKRRYTSDSWLLGFYEHKPDSAIMRHLSGLGKYPTLKVVLILGLLFLAATTVVMFPVLLAQDISAHGKFPQGISIAGVDVSGLTKEMAVHRCKTELSDLESKPLELRIDDEVFSISPGAIGLEVDYDAMVEDAYKSAWNVNIVERLVRRFFCKPKRIDAPIVTTYQEQAVRNFLADALQHIERPPHEAYIDVSTGIGQIIEAKDGRKADFDPLLLQTVAALKTRDRIVNVQVDRTPAAMTDEVFGKYILVNLGAHTLSLYDRNDLLLSYPVATGSAEWPTAIGEWAVVEKEKNPTWYNRGSAWMENMPDSIPPGPGNPLGTRAITLNGGGVLIHGTSSSWSIGRSVSHGCIRMLMPHVEELYEQVEVGMPVFIIREANDPGFDCSEKAWWKD